MCMLRVLCEGMLWRVYYVSQQNGREARIVCSSCMFIWIMLSNGNFNLHEFTLNSFLAHSLYACYKTLSGRLYAEMLDTRTLTRDRVRCECILLLLIRKSGCHLSFCYKIKIHFNIINSDHHRLTIITINGFYDEESVYTVPTVLCLRNEQMKFRSLNQ